MIRRELITLGGSEGDAPCQLDHGQIFDATTCAGAVNGLVGRVLIYVADGTRTLGPAFESYFNQSSARVIPVVDSTLGVKPEQALPRWMDTTLAVKTNASDPAPVLPRIVRSAGLLSQSPSLFVSYVHADAKDIAGQFFHNLSARTYAVFLDRYTGIPGDDFVELIDEELANKACLLALNTEGYPLSRWCHQEVATAITRKMGMIAVDLPGSSYSFPEFAHRLDATRMTVTSGRLADADVDAICDRVESWFPHEISRRPRYLDQTLRTALQAAGLTFSDAGLGRCEVDFVGGRRLIAMCTGSPDVDDFREVEGTSISNSTGATIVGSVAAARSNRRDRIDWLEQRSGITAIDEGQLARFLGLR